MNSILGSVVPLAMFLFAYLWLQEGDFNFSSLWSRSWGLFLLFTRRKHQKCSIWNRWRWDSRICRREVQDIAGIANAAQVHLWLTATNRQCLDQSFSICHLSLNGILELVFGYTGSVEGDTGWYLVALGQFGAVLVGTLWYWISVGA